jgi:hypothetical protein
VVLPLRALANVPFGQRPDRLVGDLQIDDGLAASSTLISPISPDPPARDADLLALGHLVDVGEARAQAVRVVAAQDARGGDEQPDEQDAGGEQDDGRSAHVSRRRGSWRRG